MKRFLTLMIIFVSPMSIFAQNWIIELVDSTVRVSDCSIVIDTQNYPQIAYCCRRTLGVNLYSYWLKYAKWNGISWEFQPVETTAATSVVLLGFTTSKLCIDNQNRPHIAYFKDSCISKYAYYDGNSWQISEIDSFKVATQYILWSQYMDMKISDVGVPCIGYSFINYNDSTRGIRYACKSGDSWIIQTVWEENRIPTPFLLTTAIDLDRTGYPIIAFENYYPAPIDSGYLFCVHFNGQNWNIDTIERCWNSNYYVYSLKADSSNRVHIFYQRGIHVFYAVESSDTWAIGLVAINGWGECVGEMVLDEDKPNVVYSSISDPLTHAYKKDTIWYFEIIDPHYPGLYSSLAKDNESGMHVSYVRFDDNYLCYARRESPSIAEKGVRSIAESKALIGIYPNPAKSVIRVRVPWFDKGSRRLQPAIKIFDISGKLIKEIASPPKADRNDKRIEISLKGINPGIYFLQFGKTIKKFLVVR